MKEIKKSFKTLWFPFVKGKKKTYRIDVFKKDGSFEKMYLSGKVYAKGKYKLYKVNDMHLITFVGKKYKDGKWQSYGASAVVELTSSYKKYNLVGIPYAATSGMVKLLTTAEYKDILKRKSHKSRARKSRARKSRARKSRKSRKSRARKSRKSRKSRARKSRKSRARKSRKSRARKRS
jgi:hypothetical protein